MHTHCRAAPARGTFPKAVAAAVLRLLARLAPLPVLMLPLMLPLVLPPAQAAPAASGASAEPREREVYKCPGRLYTNEYSPKEAIAKGCKTLDDQPITIIQSYRPPPKPSTGSKTDVRNDPAPSAEQKARDSDARRILEAELQKAQDELAAMKKDFNNGEPERRGDEKNYQKYIERVAEMKAAIARKEADIEALKREIAKMGAAQ